MRIKDQPSGWLYFIIPRFRFKKIRAPAPHFDGDADQSRRT
jgi:hypothetical protein